jgi:hypothetical protein
MKPPKTQQAPDIPKIIAYRLSNDFVMQALARNITTASTLSSVEYRQDVVHATVARTTNDKYALLETVPRMPALSRLNFAWTNHGANSAEQMQAMMIKNIGRPSSEPICRYSFERLLYR